METRKTEPGLTDMIRELRDETSTLAKQEIALAKAEITEKSRGMMKNAIFIMVGVALGYAALMLMLLAVRDFIFAGMVDERVSPRVAFWISPLIVAVIAGGVGWLMINEGKKKLTNEGITPEKTPQSLREEKNWLKQKIAHS